jgi:hypothetical protein
MSDVLCSLRGQPIISGRPGSGPVPNDRGEPMHAYCPKEAPRQ